MEGGWQVDEMGNLMEETGRWMRRAWALSNDDVHSEDLSDSL